MTIQNILEYLDNEYQGTVKEKDKGFEYILDRDDFEIRLLGRILGQGNIMVDMYIRDITGLINLRVPMLSWTKKVTKWIIKQLIYRVNHMLGIDYDLLFLRDNQFERDDKRLYFARIITKNIYDVLRRNEIEWVVRDIPPRILGVLQYTHHIIFKFGLYRDNDAYYMRITKQLLDGEYEIGVHTLPLQEWEYRNIIENLLFSMAVPVD